jgi:hypothetical protein
MLNMGKKEAQGGIRGAATQVSAKRINYERSLLWQFISVTNAARLFVIQQLRRIRQHVRGNTSTHGQKSPMMATRHMNAANAD